MEEKELINILVATLCKDKSVKAVKKYQGEKALQLMTADGTLFNIMPVNATGKVPNLCK